MSVEQRREQKRINAAAAARLAETSRQIEAENRVKEFAIRQRLNTLILRDIVVKSVIQDQSQAHTRDKQPLRTAQAEHESIAADIKQLNTQLEELLKQDLVKEATRKRDIFYREELARSRERLNRRSEELKADTKEKLDAANRQVRDTPIIEAAVPNLPPVDPHSTPLPLPAEPTASLDPGPSRVQPAMERQAVLWGAQRTNLVNEIRADAAKAVEQIALRRGWKLVRGPEPGASDGTSEAMDDFRQQWRMGK